MFFILLFLLNFTLFSPSLGAYFFLDDADWLVHARDIAVNHALLFTPEGGRTRPLLLLIYHAQYKLFGLNAPYYHVCNILVHFLNACLVYILARKFGARLSLENRKLFPVFAGILFSVLFAHYQPVVWLNFISESLCTLLALMSLLLFIEIFSTRLVAKRLLFFFVSLLAFSLALLSKESVYGFPFVILAASFLLIRNEKVSPVFIAPYFLIPAAHFFLTRNFAYVSLAQEPNFSSSAPALGLHFIPLTLDSITDLALSLTGIVRIPGFEHLSRAQTASVHKPLLYAHYALTYFFVLVLASLFARLRRVKQGGIFYFLKQRRFLSSPEASFILFCLLSTFFFFLPNSFFFYLFTQTGASLARYRYLYLPSVSFCLLTAFLFCSYIRSDIKTSLRIFTPIIFALICFVNVFNTLIMENYHIAQGRKTKMYVRLFESLKPPLKDGDTLALLNFPQEETVLQSFHVKAYADLFLDKKIEVVWTTTEDYIRKTRGKKHMHIITFRRSAESP